MKNKSKISNRADKIVKAGKIWSSVFFVSILFSMILPEVNMCGVVGLHTLIFVISFISFVLSLRIIILLTLNKRKWLTTWSNITNILITLLFALSIFFIVTISLGGNRTKATKAYMKSQITSYFSMVNEFYNENGYYPNDIQELSINEKKVFNSRHLDFVIKDTDNPDTFFIEANLYETEKRFPCKDIIRIVKTIGYYCDQMGNCQFME